MQSEPCIEIAMTSQVLELRRPYVVFVGDEHSATYAKTAYGLRDWAPEACLAQTRLPGCIVDLGLPEMSVDAAAQAGARSLILGVASVGGQIPTTWVPVLLQAAAAGLDIVSGMHTRLATVPGLAAAAGRHSVRLIDVRHSQRSFPTANGRRRSGKRLLTVGTDCALGKKYTALALAKAMRARGIDADFRATGQTGIMISGAGIAVDAVVADFIAGAAECLSPDAAPDHWDIIEGQGSLFHPSYSGVTLGLLHGSQPDALVLCHDPTRKNVKALPTFALPSLSVAADRYLEAARLTNPGVRLVGVSLNTSKLGVADSERIIDETANLLDVPCFDPMRTALEQAIDRALGI
jgi:uncharacterized NAD-dependent epimerase/dehydratase family protein